MKNIVKLLITSIVLFNFNSSFADESFNNIDSDMFSDYINQNSSDNDVTLSLSENKYDFEFYPYLSIKSNTRSLSNEDT